MDAPPDPRRERLDRVAGLSRLAPRDDYRVDGLSFGSATLRRNTASGRWDSLTLTLSPGAAADGAKAVKPRETSVVYPLSRWLDHGDFLDDGVSPGLRPLIVDHGLLSHPAWLVDAAPPDPPLDPASARALTHLRGSLTQAIHRDAACPTCPPPRPAGRGRSAYSTSPGLLTRQRMEYLRILGIDVTGLFDEPAPPQVECAHTAMRHEALGALFAAFPELAFEAARLLIAAPTLSPPRFVMSPMMMRGIVGAWLMGRTYRGPGASRGGDLPRPAPEPRPDDALLSEAQRAALGFAREAWGLDGPLGAFVPAMNDDSAAMPVMPPAVALRDVALVWPDGVAKPAPRLPEASPPPPPPERPKPAPKRAPKPAAESPSTTPAPGQELMTPELRALGYSDAAIKKLLKDGTLERAGYGWYRWKGG